MAWTTPATFTTGNVLTAAQMNTNVRDNTNYLFDQPMAVVSDNGVGPSIANNTITNLTMGLTILSSPGITIALATAKFTPTFAGTYQTWANFTWAANATGVREQGILQSSDATYIAYGVATPGVNAKWGVSISGVSSVLNGSTHFLQLQVAQSSGGALAVIGDGTAGTLLSSNGVPCRFGIKMLGTGS